MNSLILKQHADNVRKMVMKMAYETQSAHAGGSLSCVDLLTVLYFSILNIDPEDPLNDNRDRLAFSKAHDCKALYAVLCERGFFDKELLLTYEKDGGLPGHSTRHGVPGVEISAGSLGHGLSIAVGMAYANKIDKKNNRTFVVLSDGECDEGSTWEAVLFAGHHKLDNLIVVIDYNKIQSFGRTKEVLDLEPFSKKWKSFGWGVKEVDGHEIDEIVKVLKETPYIKSSPSVLIAHTIKGYKGVREHIDQVSSHYKPPTEEEYKQILKELK